MLNEEALSASTAHLALRATTPEESWDDAPRYSEAAGIEHHPQVTDFLPRRFRSIGLLALTGLATTAGIEALHWFAAPLAQRYGLQRVAAFDLSTGGLAAWLSAVVLLFSAATCLLIYSLRRHRVDDFKGRYRAWMGAAIVCTLLSINSVAPLHQFIAAVLAQATGWTALRGHSVWWLLVAGLPCTWIAVRTWLDARESRLAAVSLAGAFALCGVAVGSYLGIAPVESETSEAMLTSGAGLLATWLLLVGIVSYGRFVVLDVQGLIPARAARPSASKSKATKKDQEVKQAASHVAATSPGPLHTFRARHDHAESTDASSPQWVDGSEGGSDEYDDEDGDAQLRKLSKADRKRLRQQKRAA